jgi:ribonucleoside-diphosphate reductase beta chain
MLNLLATGQDDPEMQEIAEECKEDAIEMFKFAAEQEKEWAEYLFKDGSMIGLNKNILWDYIEYITNIRAGAVGFAPIYATKSNPIPWMSSWLNSDEVQVAPQEAEISSYLVGQIDSAVDTAELGDFEL